MTKTEQENAPAPAAEPSIKKVAARLSSGALFSKTLGFVREVFMAHVVGVAALADSFRSSMTIILLPLAFLQNESVPAILIPRMQEAGRNGEAARRLAAMTVALSAIGALLMVLTIVIADFLVDTMMAGVSAADQQETIYFVRIMAFSMPASVAINCLAAGEIAFGKTRVTNARAAMLNIGVMLGLCMLVLTGKGQMLAIAFTLSFNGLAIWAIWALWREGNLALRELSVADIRTETNIFLGRLVPFLPLPAAEQTSIWLERLLASRLTTGAIASMDYARTLTDSALLLVSQPIGLAVLSHGGDGKLKEQAEAITRFVAIVMMPASAFIFVFAPDIVRMIFQRGAFNALGVELTSEALRGISIGLWASTLGWILLRLLNRANRSTLAAGILVASYLANIGINATSAALQHTHTYGTFFLGLGETVRSLVMCTAVIIALGTPMSLFKLLARGLLPVALMAFAGKEIIGFFDGGLARLACGIGVYLVSVVFAAALLAPEIFGKLYRSIMSRKGTPPDA
ncbi:lipid II flippase MurJ [Rhizobium sp. B21/90]|uniref:lipid II flippase MurJ n=1 Tax=Rhizobium sp. B21/90 TaxID=2819993 RepID=UPI001C5A9569|nr:lipid II flippase MurJ [Rhizobium sp. B21/90]QYA03815.1 virulence factor MviN [Rhizobium sp. B21/90]